MQRGASYRVVEHEARNRRRNGIRSIETVPPIEAHTPFTEDHRAEKEDPWSRPSLQRDREEPDSQGRGTREPHGAAGAEALRRLAADVLPLARTGARAPQRSRPERGREHGRPAGRTPRPGARERAPRAPRRDSA